MAPSGSSARLSRRPLTPPSAHGRAEKSWAGITKVNRRHGMRHASARAAGAALLAAALAAGCSRGPTFAEVTGVLKAGGRPLENVQVEFWPEVSGQRSRGVTDKEGRFTLTSDDGKRHGAVVGSHKVVLIDLNPYAKIPVNLSREVENVNLQSSRF